MEWQEIGFDSSTIEKIAYFNGELYVEFKKGGTYKYPGVPEEIYYNILSKSCTDKNNNPSYGASLDQLVKKAGYGFDKI